MGKSSAASRLTRQAETYLICRFLRFAPDSTVLRSRRQILFGPLIFFSISDDCTAYEDTTVGGAHE
jgi:hypothetical protein